MGKKNSVDKRQIKYACLVIGTFYSHYMQSQLDLNYHFLDFWHKYD